MGAASLLQDTDKVKEMSIPAEIVVLLHTSASLATDTSGSGAYSSKRKKCSKAKRLWAYCGNSRDNCNETAWRWLASASEGVRERATERK